MPEVKFFSTPWGEATNTEGAAEYLDCDYITFSQQYDRQWGVPHIRVKRRLVFTKFMLDQWREENPYIGMRNPPPHVLGKPEWLRRSRPSDVATRLRAIGRPVISESELRQALGIHPSYWLDFMRTRPESEKPGFWLAGGVPFLTLDTAITWSESHGLTWANESRQEANHA